MDAVCRTSIPFGWDDCDKSGTMKQVAVALFNQVRLSSVSLPCSEFYFNLRYTCYAMRSSGIPWKYIPGVTSRNNVCKKPKSANLHSVTY